MTTQTISRSDAKLKSELWRWKRNKGIREYNLLINYFLKLDRLRGMSYGKLARLYKLDKNNVRARILNAT